MLSREDFKPISFGNRPIFKQHYERYPPIHSDNVFTTMISWMHYIEYNYAVVGDNLIIMTRKKGVTRFRPPSGPHDARLLREVVALAKEEGTEQPLSLIDAEKKAWISQVFPELRFTSHRDLADYVYLASDLAGLPGKNYLKIRNQISKFRRNYEYAVEPISENNLEEVHKFLRRWCLWRECEKNELLENERIAIKFSMAHFLELELSGIALRVGGDIEAISVFEKMSPDTALIHYEKAMPDYQGIYQVINNEAAKILAKTYTFINREADMGIPGLREAKRRYRPHHMVDVYHVKKDDLII